MNNRLLKKIINELENGKALWAIFWANEYLEASHPLRQALVVKAGISQIDSALARKAVQGLTLNDLSSDEQNELQDLMVHSPENSRVVRFTASPRRRSQLRRQMPGREVCQMRINSNSYRNELRAAI